MVHGQGLVSGMSYNDSETTWTTEPQPSYRSPSHRWHLNRDFPREPAVFKSRAQWQKSPAFEIQRNAGAHPIRYTIDDVRSGPRYHALARLGKRRFIEYDFVPALEAPRFLMVTSEGKRMASSLIGNEVPRMGLWVRVPCPPLRFADPTILVSGIARDAMDSSSLRDVA